ncbi:hypothetical protein V6Z11_D12G266900 [Gossypium hirsutum]
MSLSLASSPWLSRFSPPNTKFPDYYSPNNFTLFSLLLRSNPLSSLKTNGPFKLKASLNETQSNGVVKEEETFGLDEALLSRVSATKDADEALEMIAQSQSESGEQLSGGVVSVSDCRLIINAALDRNNADLALSVFYSMRSSFDTGVSENRPVVDRWKWSRPDVGIYTTLVLGLATLLRVSDALKMIDDICRVGVSPGEEVPFGKVVRCPICSIAVGVAQPQLGIQIVCCAKCRYKYELVSGNIISVDSEEISVDNTLYSCMVLMPGYSLLLRNSSCRTQHGDPSMEKGAKISANIETKSSCCCSFYSGTNPFWCGTYTQVCY